MRILATVLMLLTAAVAGAQTQRLYGPYFVSDANHSSTLLLHNKRGDRPVTADIYATGGAERLLLSRVSLQPKESRSVDLSVPGRSSGGITIDYSFFEAQPLDARVLVQHRNGSRYIVPVFRRQQIRGNVQEAVVLLPAPSARAFVALQNTTTSPRRAVVEVTGASGTVTAATVTLPPAAVELVSLEPALARAEAREAAAVRVTNDGEAGDVAAAGAVTDQARKYAARVRFNDLAHGEHSRTLRAQFLLLGRQDSSLGLPSDATFTAKCAVRNATDRPRIAHPAVKWIENGATREARLPSIRLAPHEVRVLDLSAAQGSGSIPAAFHFGTFELSYEGEHGHLFAQLTSVDIASGFALDDSMTSHESHAVAGMEWSIDRANQTLISITNASPSPDTLSVELFSQGESIPLPPLTLASGDLALLDLRRIVPAHTTGTAGTFSVRGARGSASAFRLERLMVTPSGITSDAGVPVQDGPVAYVDVDGEERVLWIRTTTSTGPDTQVIPTTEAYVTLSLSTIARWSSGTATTDETNTTEYVTQSTDLAVKAPPSPQVTVHLFSPRRSPNIGELIARFYDPCSNNYLLIAELTFSIPASAYEIYDSTKYPNCYFRPTCTGRCSTGLMYSRAFTPACFPPMQPYVQCFGLSISGRCIIRNAVCHFNNTPGYCD